MNERTLGRDWLFWLCLGVGSLIAIVSTYFILQADGLNACPSYTCFNMSLEIFSFPIQAFSAGLVFAALRGIVFRSEQTARQIEEAIKQNVFKNYFDHSKGFLDVLDSVEQKYSIVFVDKKLMYKRFFPANSPFFFSPKSADTDNFSPLFPWVERVNSHITDLNKNRLRYLNHSDAAFFVNWLAEFAVSLSEMGLEFKAGEGSCSISEFHDQKHIFKDIKVLNRFPENLEDAINDLSNIVEIVSGYCLVENVRIVHLIVGKGDVDEQLAYVCGDWTIE